MSKNTVLDTEQKPIDDFAKEAYLNYSMYVILDRALPHIADGLKPVQRRIIYAMSELGLKASAKYKKSARTVGDVLGKFHPHGDSACYEAMVLMAQDFSYRYPFIDGQGNWGSPDDPKSFAAMRYTESRLTPFAQALLTELQQGTVDWQPNFDGTLSEPKLLPARLPNILLNGATGIAVGMATDIPPHNLNEVIDACIFVLDNPKASINDIMKYITGPDYPTHAEIITSKEDIKEMYTKGNGNIRMRATYTQEQDDIIITALPHQTSGGKILEQIAAQMLAKKLPMVNDLRDESDHENPTRLVITPKSNRVDSETLMSHLFASTDLERTYRVNLNIIGTDGRPQVKSLDKIIKEWLKYRMATVKRRLEFRLQKVLDRLHILAGLLVAFINIDEIIHIIRTEDKPKNVLMKKFKLSEIQAEAILEIKLRQLAKLEEVKIRDEQGALAKEKQELEIILGSQARMKTLIRSELKEDKKSYGDERKSAIVQRDEAKALAQEQLVTSENITIILSNKGWIRAAKGHEVKGDALNYRAGDDFLMQVQGRSNQPVIVLDSKGKSYSLPSHDLPSARSLGEPLTSRLKPAAGSSFISILMGQDETQYLIASTAGYGFITTLNNLYCKNKNGKALLKLPAGAGVLPPQRVTDIDSQYLTAISNEGRLLLFPVADLPELAKGKGNKIINIPSARVAAKEEFCVAIAIISEIDSLVLYSGKRHLTLKPDDLINFQGERGRRGQKLPRGFRKVDSVSVQQKD